MKTINLSHVLGYKYLIINYNDYYEECCIYGNVRNGEAVIKDYNDNTLYNFTYKNNAIVDDIYELFHPNGKLKLVYRILPYQYVLDQEKYELATNVTNNNLNFYEPNHKIYILEAYDDRGRSLIIDNCSNNIVYKVCKTSSKILCYIDKEIPVIVKLSVPQNAQRTKYIFNSNMQRVSKVIPLEIKDRGGKLYNSCYYLGQDRNITYFNLNKATSASFDNNPLEKYNCGISVFKHLDDAHFL